MPKAGLKVVAMAGQTGDSLADGTADSLADSSESSPAVLSVGPTAAHLVAKRDETRAAQTSAMMAYRTVSAMAVEMAGRTVAVKGCRWIEQTGDERVGTIAEMKEYLMVVTTAGKWYSQQVYLMVPR